MSILGRGRVMVFSIHFKPLAPCFNPPARGSKAEFGWLRIRHDKGMILKLIEHPNFPNGNLVETFDIARS